MYVCMYVCTVRELIILFYRPIAGSVNLCPDAVQGSDKERVIDTVKHELLHAMVSYCISKPRKAMCVIPS